MFRRILVPLDGSEFSEAALPYAIGLARKAGGRVRLLSVHDEGWSLVDGEWGGALRARARYLDGQRERAARFVPDVTAAAREGAVAEQILAEADDFDADLIVMATHGRGPVGRFWLGSVAHRCVRTSRRCVLLVRPSPRAAPTTLGLDLARVVVPVDGSELGEHALGPAAELADLFGARLTLVRAVPDPIRIAGALYPENVEVVRTMFDQDLDEARAYVDRLAGALAEQGREAKTHVAITDRPAHAILEDAGADLIVMSTNARKGMDRAILGSVTDAVVRGAAGPVLVVPPGRGAAAAPRPREHPPEPRRRSA